MKTVHPYLLFRSNASEAFEFYEAVFRTKVDSRTYYREFGGEEEMGMNPGEGDLLANISLPLTDTISLMASEIPESMASVPQPGGNVQITLDAEDAEEAKRLFEALSDGGNVVQPLAAAPFAELYGEVADRFGTQWIVIFEGEVALG